MTKRVLKTILAGIFLGAAFFFMPLMILQAFIFAVAVFALFRLFIGRRFRNGNFYKMRLAFADDIRNMTDEEYEAFKVSKHGHCSFHHST